ncbi:MAG: hypothetical protein IJJ28_05320, partial [Lentisphaeria bacterium]|nr:hypothetical protein [Lentisphaeria bacterium]
MTDCDLRCIFQSILPAGEYTECVWFLPLALERMLPPAGDADLCFDVFSWIGDNAEPLAQDGLWDELLAFTEKFFAELTAAFILKNGYPENLGHVDQLIEALNDDRGAFDGMGDRLIQKHLAVADTYPRAAWLITLLEHTLYYSTTSKYLKTVARENRTPMKNAYDTIVAAVADDD